MPGTNETPASEVAGADCSEPGSLVSMNRLTRLRTAAELKCQLVRVPTLKRYGRPARGELP
jgi:hypothetical protein